MNISVDDRKPHAPLEVNQRFQKARKIEAILRTTGGLSGLAILEVGTGSGVIAHYLANVVGESGRVVAVDVVDQRQISEGYEFQQVRDTTLPFPDASFDIVISNHVIEHVGERWDQLNHLNEIHRVLKEEGVVYFAVPNRWRIVEPHYRLAFLSWWPRSLRSPYLRLFQRGDIYDCLPLSQEQITAMCTDANFDTNDKTFEAMRLVLEFEAPRFIERTVLSLPLWLIRPAMRFVPTIIYLFRKTRHT